MGIHFLFNPNAILYHKDIHFPLHLPVSPCSTHLLNIPIQSLNLRLDFHIMINLPCWIPILRRFRTLCADIPLAPLGLPVEALKPRGLLLHRWNHHQFHNLYLLRLRLLRLLHHPSTCPAPPTSPPTHPATPKRTSSRTSTNRMEAILTKTLKNYLNQIQTILTSDSTNSTNSTTGTRTCSSWTSTSSESTHTPLMFQSTFHATSTSST